MCLQFVSFYSEPEGSKDDKVEHSNRVLSDRSISTKEGQGIEKQFEFLALLL